MLLSMTGFGKSTVEIPDKKFTVEVKSLNSKQIDISARIPSVLREAELDMRSRVAERLQRGKVDLTVMVENLGGTTSVQLNLPAIKAYKVQIDQMQRELSLPQPDDWYNLLLRFPESVKTDSDTTLTEAEITALMQALDKALDELTAFRSREGAKLQVFLADRIANIAGYLKEIDPYESERVALIRRRIEEGLSSLPRVSLDQSRLEQEMIFYIEKLDVTEEKQRLNTHLNYFLETLEGSEGQGKKLGFITQEIGREINTLGSKSNHAEMQRLVVKMKDELEQIKEQVLNAL